MKRFLGIAATMAAFSVPSLSQQYPTGPYAPRQPYPTRPATPYLNPALSNYYRQNAMRQGYPGAGRYPTNPAAGLRTNAYTPASVPTNAAPSTQFQPYRSFGTNLLPGTRFGARPYAYTNALPRAGFPTNSARLAPPQPALPGYVISQPGPGLTNTSGTNAAYAPAPGTTNFLVPNPTNSQSRLALTPAQRRNIDRLSLVLNGIKTAPVTVSQKQQLLNMLRTSAQGTRKPSDPAVAKLVENLAAAWPNKGFTYQQKFQLALDVIRVLNCENLNEGEVLVVVNDARRVLQSIGVGGESASKLVDDLHAIASEVQKTEPKENPGTSEPPN